MREIEIKCELVRKTMGVRPVKAKVSKYPPTVNLKYYLPHI